MKNDDGLDGDINVKKTLPSHLGVLFSSNRKRNMNIFIREINEFYDKYFHTFGHICVYDIKLTNIANIE